MSYTLVMLPPQTDQTRSWAQRVAADVPAARVVVAEDDAAAIEALEAGAEAAFGPLPDRLLSHAGQLKWLQAPMAAPEPGYYYEELAGHQVVVTNLRGTYTDKVAAHAVALSLALARNLHLYVRQQLEHRWRRLADPAAVTHLPEATVLVVGLGAVGAEIASMLVPFGCTVLGTDARLTSPPPGIATVAPPSALDELLPLADIVIITIPHTPATERLFDAGRLARLKPSAYLVNVGRGPVVDIDALADAVEAGTLRGAALDVFPVEPLDPEHRLWDLPQVIITPHVAAAGPHADERRYAVLRDNARRFASGSELINVVDKTQWF